MFESLNNLVGSVVGKVVDEVDEFTDDPLGYTVDQALQPVRDGADVIEGITEGELRTVAAARLGADMVAGMAVGEIVAALLELSE